MKKVVTLFLCLFFSLHLAAQNISVASFVALPEDLTANTAGTMVLDQNGEKCALIKVETTQTGFTFDVGSLGVAKIEPKVGEIWVYVPAGVKRITIAHPQLGVLRDYDLGLSVQRAKTYLLKLVTGTVTTVVKEAKQQTGWIMLNSTPEGADVFINGADIAEKTPMSRKYPYGTYTYRLELDKYHSAEGTIVLQAERFEKMAEMKPAFGSVEVITSPAGASVFMDDKDAQKKTPCILEEITSGPHKLQARLENYATQTVRVDVSDGVKSPVELTMAPRFAQVIIQSLEGAEIYIDDALRGHSTFDDILMEGIHDIEVRLAHHQSVTKQLTVTSGITQMCDLMPIPMYGSLDINSKPYKAAIAIDGKNVGLSTPVTIDSLLEGEHIVTLTLDKYQPQSKRVTIKVNESASVEMELQTNSTVGKAASTEDSSKKAKEEKTAKEPKPDKKSLFDKFSCYAGLKYQFVQTSSAGLDFGFYANNFNLEVSVMQGLSSEEIFWDYGPQNYGYGYNYEVVYKGGKLGYGVNCGNRVRLTPQLGGTYAEIIGKLKDKGVGIDPDATSSYAVSASVGLRGELMFTKHIGIFLTPEYHIPIVQPDSYKKLSEVSITINNFASGFTCSAGLVWSFDIQNILK